MAKFAIYSKDGSEVRYEGEPQYSGSYMSVDYLEFRTISSPHLIEWERGDYVDYFRTGMRYKLYSHPMPKKVARKGEYGGSIEYSNVQFFGATKELEIAPFRDLVPQDNKIHFSTRPDVSTYENVYGIARRIQECVNDIFPDRWRIEVYDTNDADLLALLNETKEYSVSNGSCLDALSQIYETWKNIGWIHTYDSANDVDVITIGRANVRNADNTSDSFRYGMGNGLTSIKKAAANEGEFATRLYVYGSERNIQTRHYNQFDILNKDSVDIRNLMLPINTWGKTDGLPDARKAYLEADSSIIEKYGLIPRTVYFDGNQNEEIYPSITGLTMAGVREAMINAGQGDSGYLPLDSGDRIDEVESLMSSLDNGTKEETENQRTFDLRLREMGFNIVSQGKLTEEGFATIAMKSGACAGREFKVTKYIGTNVKGSRIYSLEKNWDESLGEAFPNKNYPIKSGDKFVLLDIPMPDFYITLAADRLLDAGQKMLADYTRVSAFYEPGINAIKIKEGGKLLRAGMYMQVYDEDIIDTEDHIDYVLIDTLTINEHGEIPQYQVTLREQKRSARTYSALEDMIVDAKEVTQKEVAKARQYTDRRFNSAQETISMLAEAFEGFSEGVSPITVRTMAMLVGDESNQFKFTKSLESLEDTDCPLVYDASTKQFKSDSVSYIKHMTLGVDAVTTKGVRTASDYLGWEINILEPVNLEDGNARYVYIKASKSDNSAEYILSSTAIEMNSVDGYYHFLVGILNSEYNENRDFITLYGFTEVLPGQITTDLLKSGNGNLIIDLVNAIITAKNGATIKGALKIEDGSLMTSRLDIGDDKGVEAFFNGGDFAKDTTKGKLILAAGIPEPIVEGDNNLEERANEASTKIYEDGTLDTLKLIAKRGNISGFDIQNDRLKVNYEYEEQEGVTVSQETEISPHRISLQAKKNFASDWNMEGYNSQVDFYPGSASYNSFAGIVRHEVQNAQDGSAFGYILGCATLILSAKGALPINEKGFGGNHALYIEEGMIGGLRPRTRVITKAGEYGLSAVDHTIVISYSTSGDTVTLILPDRSQVGQVYEIYNTDNHHDIIIKFQEYENGYLTEDTIYNMEKGTGWEGTETYPLRSVSYTAAHRRHITLVYDGKHWILTHIYMS